MATVGGSIVHGQGGISPGNVAVWAADGLLGDIAQYPTSLARTTSSPVNPTGTASTTAVMMGLAGSVTPKATGSVQITVSGTVSSSAIGDGASIQISHGTGTAPANAATLTGTQDGVAVHYVAATVAGKAPFSLTAYVAGLTVGTAYWLDLAVAATTGGTATVADISIVAIEV